MKRRVPRNDELKEKLALSRRTGALCLDTPPRSIKRWRFWKKRFLEIGVNRKILELDNVLSGQIIDTLYEMTDLEEQKND
jgi:hypothetical protein